MSSGNAKSLRAALQAIDKIQQFTVGVSAEDFYKNDEKISAVCMQFIALGERVYELKKVDFFAVSPFNDRVNWKKVAGMRHILAHDHYDDVDPEILWATIQNNISILKEAIQWHLEAEAKK